MHKILVLLVILKFFPLFFTDPLFFSQGKDRRDNEDLMEKFPIHLTKN